ncbi:hypothetical protein BKA61DRAFT_585237, partial [Leptodontidium sp. MPI-SDFR-AT-0119]
IFTNYWTTLTFLLSSPPYSYDSVIIGLFALIGIAAICVGPFYSRAVIDRFVPSLQRHPRPHLLSNRHHHRYIHRQTHRRRSHHPSLRDRQSGSNPHKSQNRSGIFAIEPKARNRVNTAYMLSVFCGQLMGTAVGNRLYAKGGWILSGECECGFYLWGVVDLFCEESLESGGWIGWKGGWGIGGGIWVRRKRSLLCERQPARGPSQELGKCTYASKAALEAATVSTNAQ